MSFTYVLSTDIGLVRLNIGDTDSTTAQLTDEEIQVALTAQGAVLPASVRCVEWIIAKLAKIPNRSVVGINSSNPLDQYTSLLAELKKRSISGGAPLTAYAGSIDPDRIDEANEDTSFVKPQFSVGMEDNPAPRNLEDTGTE